MRAKITNFRGIKRAELALGPLTLIAGPNASGKTSIALALAAAASGQPIPVKGMRKADAGMLVHSGAGKGDVELEREGGRVAVAYPRATVESEGKPPSATPYALGLADLTALEPKEAAAVLLQYLKAMPTKDDLAAALAAAKLTPEQLASIWQNTQDLGWDGAHDAAKQRGATLKGQWQGATGEQYGTAKAERWLPRGWETGLEGASEESLTAALTQAHEFREAAVAASAVTADRRDRLVAEAATRATHEEALAKATEEHAAATAAWTEERKILTALPMPASQAKTLACPHCKQPVILAAGALEKPLPFDAAAEKARGEARSAQQVKVLAAQARGEKAKAAITTATDSLRRATDAGKQLADLPEVDPTTAAQLEQAREAVKRDETRLASFRAKRTADTLHAQILQQIEIVQTLAATGLRLKKLRAAVRAFNETLSELSTAARWGRVELADDLSVVYDGKPLLLLSASECFRVTVTIRFAMAQLDESAIIVVDAADILDKPGRNGLMRVAAGRGVPVVVCMTMQPDQLPPSSERCRVYWLESGTARENAQAQ